MTPEEAREIIDDFAEDSEDAYRLALAASLAARIEPELVRALRLDLFKGTDAGAEADLWFSPLVQSQTPLALEFAPEALELLRQDLAEDQELLQATWEVLKNFHDGAPFALQLEEELTYLGLSGESNKALIEKRLNSVLTAVRAGQRAGLARWASRALPSLPGKVSDTEAARRLSFVAGQQTGVGPVLGSMPSKGIAEELLSDDPAKKIARVKVGVRLLKNETPAPPPTEDQPLESIAGSGGMTIIGPGSNQEAQGGVVPDVLPMLVEFSYPPAPESKIIEVPDTYRLLLEVSWQEGEQRSLRQLSLLPDETRRVEVGYGEVRIRTALGDVFTLSPRFDYDFMLIYDISVEGWARNLVERLERQERSPEGLMVTAAPLDPGPLSELEEKLKQDFSLSRKIGYALSDSYVLSQLEPARPEPRWMRDWLIPIRVEGVVPYLESGSPTAVAFGGEVTFDDSFRALWKAITGEDLPLPVAPQKTTDARAAQPARIFISYTHKDKEMRDQLLIQLDPLEKEGLITNASGQTSWNDAMLSAGQPWQSEIERALGTAQIILLLISADYLSSEYSSDVELAQSVRQQETGGARVIPVILRPCNWRSTVLGQFQVLPEGGRPITEWRSRSEAYAKVAEGVRRVAEQIRAEQGPVSLAANIPRPPVVGFVARRDAEGRDIVERLTEELAPQGNRLVTLSGPGGIGKSTLAAEAARALREVFGGRIVWSSAEKRADFILSTLLDDVATQLGHEGVRTLAPDEKSSRVYALVADAPTLVVLDNYETIAPDAKKAIEEWFSSAECSALFTSRHRIESTRNIAIAAMSRDEAQDYLERLIAETQDRQIFSEEVRQRIYETAEGNPFVIQWVVAQIDLGQELSAVLEELAQGEGEAAERVFDRSFNLPQLGEDGRAALLALSLFTPSASREALAEVAGFGEDSGRVNEAVRNLSELWLIKGLDENSRFAVEGLTRTLARARLQRDERATGLRRRFVEHFMKYATAHARPTLEDFEALDAEKDDLLAAVDTAFELEDWESVMQTASALGDFLELRGYWDEALRGGQRALEAARRLGDERAVAGFAYNLAVIHKKLGDFESARQLYVESLEIGKRLGDDRGIAAALQQLGRLAQDQGEVEEARRLYDESLVINKRLGDERGIAVSLQQLGSLVQTQGQVEEARHLYRESLEISKRLNDQSGIATTLHQLGVLAQTQGELDEAHRLYDESLEINKRLGNQGGVAISLQQLAALANAQGDTEEAHRLYTESLEIDNRIGNQDGIAITLHQLGRLAEGEGNKAEAARLYRGALSIFERLKSPNAEMTRRALAHLEGEAS